MKTYAPLRLALAAVLLCAHGSVRGQDVIQIQRTSPESVPGILGTHSLDPQTAVVIARDGEGVGLRVVHDSGDETALELEEGEVLTSLIYDSKLAVMVGEVAKVVRGGRDFSALVLVTCQTGAWVPERFLDVLELDSLPGIRVWVDAIRLAGRNDDSAIVATIAWCRSEGGEVRRFELPLDFSYLPDKPNEQNLRIILDAVRGEVEE